MLSCRILRDPVAVIIDLGYTRLELLLKQTKVDEESGEAIASNIMKNIVQGPIVSLREPSFELSHQPQAQAKTDKKTK